MKIKLETKIRHEKGAYVTSEPGPISLATVRSRTAFRSVVAAYAGPPTSSLG